MESYGYGVEAILANSDISPEQLSSDTYFIEPEQCHVVVSNIVRISDSPCIGLKIGVDTGLEDLGIIGYAMASSETLRQMIEIWTRYGQSPVGFPFSFPVSIDDSGADGSWYVSAPPIGVSGRILQFYIEETLAMGIKNFEPMLTGVPFELERIDFPYSDRDAKKVYERFFGCPIKFGAVETRVVVRSPDLDTKTHNTDAELRELCLRHCGFLVEKLGRHGPVGTRVWNSLRTRVGNADLEGVSKALGMSPRTLRRRLRDEGTTYQGVLDDFRHTLAKAYLNTGMISAKEVSYLLGFAQVGVFRRAFKKWTGMTVGEYQAEVSEGASVDADLVDRNSPGPRVSYPPLSVAAPQE